MPSAILIYSICFGNFQPPMSRNILIVEDEDTIARLCKKELELHDTTVTIVHDGKEAIEHIQTQKPDLVLLDLLMPHVDGYAVLAYCKEHKIRIPVIIIFTNLGDSGNRRKCRAMGAEEFIIKADNEPLDVWERVKSYLPAV